jgi:hypothetical protein
MLDRVTFFADEGHRPTVTIYEGGEFEEHGTPFAEQKVARVKASAIFAVCWTPCDNTAVSGARWFKGKGLRKLAWSMDCCATGAEVINELNVPGFVENPVSTLAIYWRKPDYSFHPHEFTGFAANDNYTKKTCIWGFEGFVMPAANPLADLTAPDNRIHACPPGEERRNIRSATPKGFARALFEANRHLINQRKMVA